MKDINLLYIDLFCGAGGTSTGVESAKINGNTVPVINGTANAIASFDTTNLFTTDPDGAGVGLDDMDGDGYYDDLPPGKIANIVITIQVNIITSCNWSQSNNGIDGDVLFTTMCSSSITTPAKIRTTNPFNIGNAGSVS